MLCHLMPAATRSTPNRLLPIALSSIALLCLATAGCGALPRDTFHPADREVCLSGYEWEARFGPSPGGAASNRWGAGPANVESTGAGLRLALAHDGSGWLAAEVRTELPANARRVEFDVLLTDGEVAENVVLGLFVYRNDRHELDIEASRWGIADAPLWQFALQTPNGARTWRFDLNSAPASTHSLEWGRGRVEWNSNDANASEGRTRRITPRRLSPRYIHMNLWLDRRRPPGVGNIEVLVTAVRVFDRRGARIPGANCGSANARRR